MGSWLEKRSTSPQTVTTLGQKIGMRISNNTDKADPPRLAPHRSSDALSQVGSND